MIKIEKKGQLDRYDLQIVEILSKDGRLAVTDLAKQVGLSKSPCQVRLKRLREQGFILGFQAVLNHEKLGRDHVAFIEVKLSQTTEKALSAFNEAIISLPEVEQCYLIAGSFDYLLKVRTTDINSYRRVLGEKISTLPHVANTSTHVSMQAVKEVGR